MNADPASPPGPAAELAADPSCYLDLVAARGLGRAEILVSRTARDEVTAAGGALLTTLSVDSTAVNLRLGTACRSCHVTAGAADDPRTVVERGARLLAALPARPERSRRPAPAPEGPRPRRVCAAAAPRRPQADLATLLAGATGDGCDGQEHLEIRAWTQTRTVHAARPGSAPDSYTTGLFGAIVRVAHRRPGRVGHSTQLEHCANEATFRETLLPSLLARARSHARALSREDAAAALPDVVILDAAVAAHVLGLTVDSFLADAVVQQWSRFGDDLGRRIASPRLDLVDDALAHGPLQAPFDDEGVPTARRALITGGTLTGFLADRAHSAVAGAAAGSGWKPWASEPPRPGPANLLLSDADPVDVTGVRLRIVETYGGHIANPVTGDFSFGAAALIERPGELPVPVTGLSVAGNAFDVLRACRAARGPARWFAAHGAYLGCPDLLTEGLVIGR